MYVAVLVPALLFTLVHIQPLNKQAILLGEVLLVGLLLSYSRAATGSLVPAIIGHALANIGGVVAGKIASRRNHSM